MKKVLFGFVTIVIVMSFATAAHAYYSGSTYVGGQYRYFYYDYSGSTSGKPLVIMLHGATGSGTEFFTPVHNPGGGVKNYCEKMKKFFVDNGYVVVAPSSRTNVNPPSSGPTQPYEFDLRIRWEHETASYASNEDLQLINYLKGTWASQRGINTSQVFVWGNSSGGFMAGRCAQYFGTGLKGVIIIDAGDPSQFVLDNDCIIENSDFLDNNNITFAANHSPVLSITNQYSDVWTNGPYGTVEILRKEVNLNYAQKMIGNVADSTNWVIPCDVSALGESNHAWTSWGDNYYDEMLSWMTDRINGNNDSKTVYWEGWSNLFSDANVWFSPSGSLPAPDSNDWARVTGNLCIIKGVANPGYLVVGWTDRYGNDEHGSIRQQKFAGSSKDSLCVVEESLSLGACADVSKNGLYYLENGSLQVLGTTYASYFGQTSYGHFFQYAGTSAYFRDVRMGGGTNAQGYTNHEGGTFQCRYLYVGDHAGSVLNGYRIWDGTLHVEYDMNNGYNGRAYSFQYGGTVNVNNRAYMGRNANSHGTWTMNGGSFNTDYLHVGEYGEGIFDQNAGVVDVDYTLYIERYAGSNGYYQFTYGSLYAGDLEIGTGGVMDIDLSTITTFRVYGNKQSKLQGYVAAGKIIDSSLTGTIGVGYNGTYTYLYIASGYGDMQDDFESPYVLNSGALMLMLALGLGAFRLIRNRM